MKVRQIAKKLNIGNYTIKVGELFIERNSICARLPDTEDGDTASVTVWWERQGPHLINERCVTDPQLDALREIVEAG